MIAERTTQTLSPSPKTPGNTTARDDSLQVEMWVLGEHGKSLGTLDALHHDAATGHVSEFVVRRGIVSQRRLVPVSWVTDVTPRSVQIRMGRAAFKLLPLMSGYETRD